MDFVKHIILPFRYIAQETGKTEMSWCEKATDSQAAAELAQNNYETSKSIIKYADSLGVSTSSNEQELIIEASSGIFKEDLKHSLIGTIKIIPATTNALNYIVQKYKNATIETLQQKVIFGVQVIEKRVVTLTKVTLKPNSNKWRVIKLRFSTVPTDWKFRFVQVSIFKLMTTLLVS